MNSFTFPSWYRKPSNESETESARETSSDSSGGYCRERGAKSVVNGSSNQPNFSDASIRGLQRISLSDKNESCSALGQLVFEYFERETPYNREPLADKARPFFLWFGSTLRLCQVAF